MTDDSRNAEEVNSITTPQENRTPTASERREQPKAPAWAIGIQQALERLIEVTTQNIAPGREPQREVEPKRRQSPSPHPPDRLRIIHEFLKLKPPRYSGVDPAVDPYQFMDQIERIGKMLGCTNHMLIELIGYQLDDVAHYWYIQHVEKRLDTASLLTWE